VQPSASAIPPSNATPKSSSSSKKKSILKRRCSTGDLAWAAEHGDPNSNESNDDDAYQRVLNGEDPPGIRHSAPNMDKRHSIDSAGSLRGIQRLISDEIQLKKALIDSDSSDTEKDQSSSPTSANIPEKTTTAADPVGEIRPIPGQVVEQPPVKAPSSSSSSSSDEEKTKTRVPTNKLQAATATPVVSGEGHLISPEKSKDTDDAEVQRTQSANLGRSATDDMPDPKTQHPRRLSLNVALSQGLRRLSGSMGNSKEATHDEMMRKRSRLKTRADVLDELQGFDISQLNLEEDKKEKAEASPRAEKTDSPRAPKKSADKADKASSSSTKAREPPAAAGGGVVAVREKSGEQRSASSSSRAISVTTSKLETSANHIEKRVKKIAEQNVKLSEQIEQAAQITDKGNKKIRHELDGVKREQGEMKQMLRMILQEIQKQKYLNGQHQDSSSSRSQHDSVRQSQTGPIVLERSSVTSIAEEGETTFQPAAASSQRSPNPKFSTGSIVLEQRQPQNTKNSPTGSARDDKQKLSLGSEAGRPAADPPPKPRNPKFSTGSIDPGRN